MIFRRPRPAISANCRNYNELRASIPKARQISVYRRRTGKTAPNTGSKCGGSEKAPTGGSKQETTCGVVLSLIVLSLLIVAGATRSPRPRPLQIYTAPTAPAGTHWKNRPNISRKGVVGRGRGVKILKPIPGATLTGRTIFPRVINFRGGCTNECTGAESLQRLRQQRQHGNGARITKNNAGRGTPSTPQARPSDVKRRTRHKHFSTCNLRGRNLSLSRNEKTGGTIRAHNGPGHPPAVMIKKTHGVQSVYEYQRPRSFFSRSSRRGERKGRP